MTKKTDPSYEWVILRETNISYISDRTGISKHDLKAMLEKKKEQGIFEIPIPLGIHIFTREEK